MKNTILAFVLSLFITNYLNASLSFEQALQKVLCQSPLLAIAEEEILMRGAEAVQVNLLPNPEFAVIGENLGGLSRNSDSNEVLVGLSQLIELGGKRSARRNVACASKIVAYWDREIIKNDLTARLKHAFIDAALAQENLQLLFSQTALADECVTCLRTKADNGKINRVEQKRAEIKLKNFQLTANRLKGQLEAAKNLIASLWGGCSPDFDSVDFAFHDLICLNPIDNFCEQLLKNAHYQKLVAESERASRQMELQNANSVPDVVVRAGVDVYESDRRHPISFSVSFPIPIFNMNQGNRSRASIEYSLVQDKILDFETQLNAQISTLYESWDITRQEAETLKESMIPFAEESVQQAQESFDAGKTEYLDVLEARRILLDLKIQYLAVLADFHHKSADLEKLTYSFQQH